MKEASNQYGWNLDYGKIALIWRGGCIIRSKFLNFIYSANKKNLELKNLLLDDFFITELDKCQVFIILSLFYDY